MVFDILIIGAGASGVVAGIEFARRGKRVAILEHKDRILKKLLVTGNGRCNYTNINASPKNYFAKNEELVDNLFSKITSKDTITFFSEIGILPKEEQRGKVYPNSLQAASIVDALRNQLEYLGVYIFTGVDVKNVYKKGDMFFVEEYSAPKLVIATGGCSYKELGSDGSGYDIAKSFGHSITKLDPVLVQLKTEKEYVKGLEGIRQDVNLRVEDNNKLLRSDFGELLFTPYGISGPTIFNLSYLTALYGFDIDFVVDFMPDLSEEELKLYLFKRRDSLHYLEATDFLNGVVHKKLGMFLLKKAGIEKLNIPIYEITDDNLNSLVRYMKRYVIRAFETTGFKQAQVTSGGVDSREVKNNFESKKCKGLYLIGEVLDVFGDCGGYNLQFAFGSAMLIGREND